MDTAVVLWIIGYLFCVGVTIGKDFELNLKIVGIISGILIWPILLGVGLSRRFD